MRPAVQSRAVPMDSGGLCCWCRAAADEHFRTENGGRPSYDDLVQHAQDNGKRYGHMCDESTACYCQCRQMELPL